MSDIDPRAPIASEDLAVDLDKGTVQFRGRRIMAIDDDVVAVPIGILVAAHAQILTMACGKTPIAAQIRKALENTPMKHLLAPTH